MQSNNAFAEDDSQQQDIDMLADLAAMLNHCNANQKLEAKKPLRLDIPTILAINAGLEKIEETGHGKITIEITQSRFSKLEWTASLIFPQNRKRSAAR